MTLRDRALRLTPADALRRWSADGRALTCALVMAVAGTGLVTAQDASAPARTVWDGVYTDTQANRAVATFSESCASCHTLASTGESPLSGDSFWEGFTQRTVGDLLTYVSTSMPNGRGGSLPAASYNDLVALILQSNGLPAGKTELTPDTIAAVQIVPKGGAGELPANTLVRVFGCLARTGSEWTLTNATAPERVEKVGAASDEANRPLGTRTVALKFVLTKLDAFNGHRMSVTGLLMGAGGADGINVTTVNRVTEACP